MRLINLKGRVFGRLAVVRRVRNDKDGEAQWLCLCQCGKKKVVRSYHMRSGNTKSCGCYMRQRLIESRTKHGLSGTKMHTMFLHAKTRAKQRGLEFSIKLQDIIIPTHCPVLGIPLIAGHGKSYDNSPTLDRVNTNEGYTKKNTRVISYRANSIKRNAAAEELIKIVKYILEHDKAVRLLKEVVKTDGAILNGE